MSFGKTDKTIAVLRLPANTLNCTPSASAGSEIRCVDFPATQSIFFGVPLSGQSAIVAGWLAAGRQSIMLMGCTQACPAQSASTTQTLDGAALGPEPAEPANRVAPSVVDLRPVPRSLLTAARQLGPLAPFAP